VSSVNTDTTPGQAEIDAVQLSEADRLLLQQLQTLRWLAEEHAVPAEPPAQAEMLAATSAAAVSGDWSLTGKVDLYDWQRECVDSWFRKEQGTVKVVTGAGKTLLALAIAERLHN
jgi:superfamily II DNA or RNA helicase